MPSVCVPVLRRMAHQTVFKDVVVFEELKAKLFGSSEDQLRGLGLGKALATRGPLPTSVHLTLLLVSAIHTDRLTNDAFAIREAYAMALVRVVNETLDHEQTGTTALPLTVLAREIGMPQSFVELRHSATHDELPSVYTLRMLARQALSWLWDVYWVVNPPGNEGGFSEVAPPTQSAESEVDIIKDMFREWRRLRRINPLPDMHLLENQRIQDRVLDFWKNQPELLLDTLFNRNIVYAPNSCPDPATIQAIPKIYGSLLFSLGQKFREAFFKRLVHARNQMPWPGGHATPESQVLDAWLEAAIERATSTCIVVLQQLPRPWNARLLARYGRLQRDARAMSIARDMADVTGANISGSLARADQLVLEAALQLPDALRAQPVCAEPANQASMTAPEQLQTVPMHPTRQGHSWKTVTGWTPRPLGII